MSEFSKTQIQADYERAYTIAKIRNVEVANFLGVHRVTASNYRNKGFGKCDDITQRRLLVFLKVVEFGLEKKYLPLDTSEISGFRSRITAFKRITKKYKASLKK